ncbi:MAG: hypothetical protein M0P13_00315 [Fibrobacteraceae bacterium]|nr:hypothetical protein [Fibrobacteraceae bacterium]
MHFRNRIGEKGLEVILKESVLVNDDHNDEAGKPHFIDSSVQEKNTTFPTNASGTIQSQGKSPEGG